MPEVTKIYTDGACSGNPGPGGWGAIAYLSNGKIHEIGGSSRATTNNRMEIQAAIEILRWFADSPQTKAPALYTDSKYVQDGITKWIKGWKKKNWRTSAGKAVLNQDLWQQLDAITQSVNAKLTTPVQWCYVKGHAGNEGNERCDAIARAFSHGRHPALMTMTPWADGTERPLASAAVAESLAEDEADTDKLDSGSPDLKAISTNALGSGDDKKTSSKRTKTEENEKQDSETTGTSLKSQPKSAESEGVSRESQAIAQSTSPSDRVTMSQAAPTSSDDVHSTDASAEDTAFNVKTCQQMIERLRIADEIASNGYWITTGELSLLLNLNESQIRENGDRWIWRNWSVLRVRRPDSPGLWQLERID